MDQTSSLDEAADELSPETQAAIDAALARVDEIVAADPDLVHGDVVEQIALESELEVAVQMCEQSMGFVPDTIRQRLFEFEHADTIAAGAVLSAERKAAEEKAQQRSARAAATRAKTLAAEAAAQSANIRSATCPDCFQVRSPSGVCGCD
jgi:hypothetical protein